jgi:hypothetical protein
MKLLTAGSTECPFKMELLIHVKMLDFRAGFKEENSCMLFVSVCALLTVSYEFGLILVNVLIRSPPNFFFYSAALKMMAAGSSMVLSPMYQITWCHPRIH